MVVVLDAIDNEKLELELEATTEGTIELPLDSNDELELTKSRRFPPLSRKGRRIIRLSVAAFAFAISVFSLSLVGRSRHKEDHELSASLAQDNGKENQGFGFLSRILSVEKAEKHFLYVLDPSLGLVLVATSL